MSRCVHRRDASSQAIFARHAPGRACPGKSRCASAVQHEARLGSAFPVCAGRWLALADSGARLLCSTRPGFDLLLHGMCRATCPGKSRCASAAQHEAHLELPLQPPPGDLTRPRVRLTGAPAVQPVRAGSHAAASPALSARCPAGVCRAHSRTPLRHRPAAFARPFCPGFLDFISRVARASRGNA